MPNSVSLVYYIGAGASMKSLPLAKDTPSRMRDLAKKLSNGDFGLDSHHKFLLDGLCGEMKELAGRATPSIDVLAHRYYLQGNDFELRRLKATLSGFFLLEQSRQPSDHRYVDFFAQLAGKDDIGRLLMPTDIRVVSWNYDMQFEKSFAEFIPDMNPGEKRNSAEMLQIVPTGVESNEHYAGIFSIFKLNGTAGARDSHGMLIKSYDPVIFGQLDGFSGLLSLTLHFFEKVTRGDDEPYLRFAWEDDDRRDNVLKLIERFSPVSTVVVIGYSFPLFNRGLDRMAFELLSPNEVFLQVAGDTSVKDRLVGIGVTSEKIRVVNDTDQFHIPNAYSPSAWLSRKSREEVKS